jgi:hypothetical protein
MATERVPLSDVLCAGEREARAALELAGCVVEPELSMTEDHPMLGTIHRLFGVVRNLAQDAAGQTISAGGHVDVALPPHVATGGEDLRRKLVGMLDDPDNDRVAASLRSGTLSYMPANKRVAMRLRKTLGDGGAHLPWGLQPLNLDLSMRVQRHCSDHGFVVFYSRAAKLPVGSPPVVELSRVFSTPFGVTGFGTWQEPISQEILDPDVGLLLEASWVG